MMEPKDAYWDELGIAWTAIEPDLRASMPRMKRQMRWHALAMVATTFGGAAVSIAGGVLGTPPKLADLDEGDIRFRLDFRQLYASILADWLRVEPAAVVGPAAVTRHVSPSFTTTGPQ